MEGGVGGGRTLLQFYGIIETLEENKVIQLKLKGIYMYIQAIEVA